MMRPTLASPRCPPRPSPDDRVQGVQSVGQCGGSGLQDQGRLDLMQFAVPRRGNLRPTWACRNLFRSEFLPTPGTDDHLGRRIDDLLRIGNDPPLPQAAGRASRENVAPPCDFYQFRYPSYPADQGLIPFLEKNSR